MLPSQQLQVRVKSCERQNGLNPTAAFRIQIQESVALILGTVEILGILSLAVNWLEAVGQQEGASTLEESSDLEETNKIK